MQPAGGRGLELGQKHFLVGIPFGSYTHFLLKQIGQKLYSDTLTSTSTHGYVVLVRAKQEIEYLNVKVLNSIFVTCAMRLLLMKSGATEEALHLDSTKV